MTLLDVMNVRTVRPFAQGCYRESDVGGWDGSRSRSSQGFDVVEDVTEPPPDAARLLFTSYLPSRTHDSNAVYASARGAKKVKHSDGSHARGVIVRSLSHRVECSTSGLGGSARFYLTTHGMIC